MEVEKKKFLSSGLGFKFAGRVKNSWYIFIGGVDIVDLIAYIIVVVEKIT